MPYRRLITKHGEHTFPVHSLHGSAVLVLDRIFRMRGTIPLQPGTLFIPRLEKPTERIPRVHFKHQVFRYGLYDALRWAIHVKRGYYGGEGTKSKGEIRSIENLCETIKRVLKWLDVSPSDLPPESREPANALIMEQAKLLGMPRDEHKVRAQMLLMRGSNPQDSLGRMNVSAQMASIAGSPDNLGLRIGLINFIVPRIGMREIALLNEADRVRKVFVDVWGHLGRAINHYVRQEHGEAGFEVGEARTTLITVKIGPYPAHVRRIVADLDKSANATDQLVSIRRARESLRLKRARWELEGIVTLMSMFVHARQEPNDAMRQAWVTELAKFRARLAGINESGFKKPVVASAVAQIERAEDALVNLEVSLVCAKRLVLNAARGL